MTYKQIEKEFDECEHLETGMCDMNVAKSFLKQSFIKYLKDEVEETKAMIAHTPDEVAKLNQHLPSTLQRATYSEAVGYCKAISDQITHITNQIKELEV